MKRKDFSKLQITVQNEKESYFEHEEFIGGVPPFLRGIDSTMYFNKPLKTEVLSEIEKSSNVNSENEIAEFLSSSFTKVQKEIKNNQPLDKILSNITFRTTLNENHFEEIAKIRALRMLWAKMIQSFKPTKQELLALQIEVSTTNSFDTSVAILAGCQSLKTTKNTYLIFEEESNINKTIDPWAGSFQIEKRTEEIAVNSWRLFQNKSIS